MMVSISDNLDALEDDMMIKCAECESESNFIQSDQLIEAK